MNMNRDVMKGVQEFLNYTDEQMKEFTENERNMEVFQKSPELLQTKLRFEVIKGYGCVCGIKQGQVLTVHGNGAVDIGESSGQICVYLMQAISPLVYAAQEFVLAGMDPSEIYFNTAGCLDTGVSCGGFGRVVVKMSSKRKE